MTDRQALGRPLLEEVRAGHTLGGPAVWHAGYTSPPPPPLVALCRSHSPPDRFTQAASLSAKRPCSESPKAWRCRSDALVRRGTSSHQWTLDLYVPLPGTGAMGEVLKYQRRTSCIDCCMDLGPEEVRRGVGLCDQCYDECPKVCAGCHRRLKVKQLHFGSSLCRTCFDVCERNCRACGGVLSAGDPNWDSGLCSGCLSADRSCCKCSASLEFFQARWGTGLCDPCYNEVQKTCQVCTSRIDSRQLRWSSGLCNSCYDESEKQCRRCQTMIQLGSLHYRTALCDACYDDLPTMCNICKCPLGRQEQLPLGGSSNAARGVCGDCYNLCPKTCWVCKHGLQDEQLHWDTGVCDRCYEHLKAGCRKCGAATPFGTRHWNSFLCDRCYDGSEKVCRGCNGRLRLGQMHWGSTLCNPCYDSFDKVCRGCSCHLPLGEVHWGTGVCNSCFDQERRQQSDLGKGVWAVILAQFAFYLAPEMLKPSLYVQIQDAGYLPSAADCYAGVLMTSSVAAMVAPVLLGIWADRRGEREVYVAIGALGALCALMFLVPSLPSPAFAAAWAGLNAPQAVRGVRAAYFSRRVAPEELSRACQLASSFGLIGGFVGPVLSIFVGAADLPASAEFSGFHVLSAAAGFALAPCAALLAWAVAPPHRRAPCGGTGGAGGGHEGASHPRYVTCERCVQVLSEEERSFTTSLCNNCYDNFAGVNFNFRRYSRRILLSFCLISALLEAGMNAGVVGTFQPIAVGFFGWGNEVIAAVNLVGAGLSVVVSLLMAHLRLSERVQMTAAAMLYALSVLVYSTPPLSPYRLVIGLVLGLKAQIIFMAPFTAIFSRLIGKARITNKQTTCLCLAPAIGAVLGTAVAPSFVRLAGTPAAMLSALPSSAALACIALWWRLLKAEPPQALNCT